MERNIDAEYAKDIARYDLLTPAEERAAAERGDVDTLVNHNLRLVVSIAQRYAGMLPMMDLIQEGNMGLIQAAQHYDVSYGTKFSTYAVYWIKSTIIRAIATQGEPVRLPGRVNDAVHKYKNVVQDYVIAHGTEPTDRQVAEAMGVDISKVREWRRISDLTVMSLDAAEDCNIYDMIPGVDEPEDILIGELAADISEALEKLTDGERYAVMYIYGLDGIGTHTKKETAEIMGLSHQRVSQLEKSAIRKLQHSGVLTGWANSKN